MGSEPFDLLAWPAVASSKALVPVTSTLDPSGKAPQAPPSSIKTSKPADPFEGFF